MPPVPQPPFSRSTIEAVASILGETDGGLSNKEIGDLLEAAKIRDPKREAERLNPAVRVGERYIHMSKVDRIRLALSDHQTRTSTGGALNGFVDAAMSPQRYVQSPSVFNDRRDRLNEVLALVSLALGDDGRLYNRREPAALSLSEAARLAGAITVEPCR
jgi:hypothetical protein